MITSASAEAPALQKHSWFDVLLFLYFVTLHADQLGFTIGGVTIRINNAIALLLALLFLSRFQDQLLELNQKLAAALLCITVSFICSALFSAYTMRSLLFLGWYGMSLFCYLLLPYFLIKYYDSKKIMFLYAVSFIIVGIYALTQLLLSFFHIRDPLVQQSIAAFIARPNAATYEPSFYALYMTPYVVLCNFHYMSSNQEDFYFPKRLNFFKLAMINALYLISFSTSALFAYIISFSLILLLPQYKSFRGKLLKFCLVFTSFFMGFAALFPNLAKMFFMKFFVFGFMTHHSFLFRWSGIVNAWHIFCQHPLFGAGPGAVPLLLYDAYLSGNESYVFFEKCLKEMTINPIKYFEPTNVFSEMMASLGIVGMISFGYLIYVFIKQAKQSHYSNSLNLVLSTLVMLIVLQFNQGLLRTYIWAHLALCFALFEKKRAVSS